MAMEIDVVKIVKHDGGDQAMHRKRQKHPPDRFLSQPSAVQESQSDETAMSTQIRTLFRRNK